MATHTTKEVSIRCDDMAENLVVIRHIWDDGDTWCAITIEDSYLGSGKYRGVLGRIKHAWCVLTGRPVSYAEIIVNDLSKMRKFLENCILMIDDTTTNM